MYDDLSGINSYSKTADFLAWIWPEKFKASSPEGFMCLINESKKEAQNFGMSSIGIVLIACLNFIGGTNSFNASLRYPELSKIKDRMLKLPASERSKYFFKVLKKRVTYYYRPYRLPLQYEHHEFIRQEKEEFIARFCQVTLDDLERITNLEAWIMNLYPGQYMRCPAKKRTEIFQNSLLMARTSYNKYRFNSVLQNIWVFAAFYLLLRISDALKAESLFNYWAEIVLEDKSIWLEPHLLLSRIKELSVRYV